jgi:hypothetical protein
MFKDTNLSFHIEAFQYFGFLGCDGFDYELLVILSCNAM